MLSCRDVSIPDPCFHVSVSDSTCLSLDGTGWDDSEMGWDEERQGRMGWEGVGRQWDGVGQGGAGWDDSAILLPITK